MESKITIQTPKLRSSKNQKSMEKLRESVIRLASSRNSPLSSSQIDDRLRSIFASSPPLRTPIHPSYSEMIIGAIGELSERGGSKVESISRAIESKYNDLPFAHPRLLSHHLGKMLETGEIVCDGKLRYGLVKCSPNPNLVDSSRKESKKGKKKSRGRGGKAKNGELQLVVRDEMIALPESNSTSMYQNECKEPRIDGNGVQERLENECLGGRDVNVPILGAAGDDGHGSSQLKLATVNGEEHLESVCGDGLCAVSPGLQFLPVIKIAPLHGNLEKHIVSFSPPEQHDEQGMTPRSMPSIGGDYGYVHGQFGVQERLVKDQVMTSVVDAKTLFSQLQRMFVIETLQKFANEPNRTLPVTEQCGELGFVAKEPTRMVIGKDNGCVVSPQLHLQNPNRQNEHHEQGRSNGILGHEQPDTNVSSTGADGNTSAVLPQLQMTSESLQKSLSERNELLREPCGEPELAVKQQNNGYTVSPQLQLSSMVEMQSLQQLNKKNEPLRRVKSMARQVPQQHREQEIAVLVCDQATSVSRMEQLPFPTMQDESPSQLQGDKKKGRRGRPKKNQNPGDLELKESLVEVQTITTIGDGNSLVQSGNGLNEERQVVQQKRKDGRGRPRKRPYVEQQEEQRLVLKDYIITAKRIGGSFDNVLMVSPVISSATKAASLHGRGRPKKMKPEFELRVEKLCEASPLQKKKNGRGRPRKKPEFALQSELDPLLKIKDGRGRSKKKKPNFEQEGERQLESQDGKLINLIDENGVTYPPLIDPKPKRGRGRPRKNKDSTELLQEQQQPPRHRPGRPPGKRKEMESSNADVHNDENRLKLMNEANGDSIATEVVPSLEQEKLDCEMVKEHSMAPPLKTVSKATLKRLQQPQLPKRQLRPRLNQDQPLLNSETSQAENTKSRLL
ncbi:hypothetical protein Sjap_024833 [Stephania japonica]|uniref:H15 domain-containing protein n=1 Tax=Stephania japonica TaxID=461633 RepID=A0AAP0EE26_9MAGN